MFALADLVVNKLNKKRTATEPPVAEPIPTKLKLMPSTSNIPASTPATAPAPAEPSVVEQVAVTESVEAEEAEEEEEEEEEEEDAILPSRLPTIKDDYAQGRLHNVPTASQVYPHDDVLNEKIIIYRGDICELKMDAIVNAANRALLGGGGVDGAIHRAAGPGLVRECRTLHGAETGESKITGGHLLPSTYVIHTVGPVYNSSRAAESERLLRSCYKTTLALAVQNNCKTIAFSGISTGVYGYPIDAATRVALDVVRSFLMTPEGSAMEKVVFTVFRSIDVTSYKSIMSEFFPAPPPPTSVTENKVGDEEGAAHEGGEPNGVV